MAAAGALSLGGQQLRSRRAAAGRALAAGGLLFRFRLEAKKRLSDAAQLAKKGARSVREHFFRGSKTTWITLVLIFQLINEAVGPHKVICLFIEVLRRSAKPVRGKRVRAFGQDTRRYVRHSSMA